MTSFQIKGSVEGSCDLLGLEAFLLVGAAGHFALAFPGQAEPRGHFESPALAGPGIWIWNPRLTMLAASESLAVTEIFSRGGPIMWVILAASVLGAAFFVERLFILREQRVVPTAFVQRIRSLVGEDKVAQAELLCQEHASGIARLMATALGAHQRDESRAQGQRVGRRGGRARGGAVG